MIQGVPELRVPKQTLITFLFFDLETWYSGLMNFIDIHFDIRNYFGTLKAKNISYDYMENISNIHLFCHFSASYQEIKTC